MTLPLPKMLIAMLSAPDHLWSIGTGYAVAGFLPSGHVCEDALGLWAVDAAANAWLRLSAAPKILAFETISSDPTGWNHAIALCQTAQPAGRRDQITAIGADRGAIHAADRARAAFSLGQDGVVRVLFRPDDSGLAAMTACCGHVWGPDFAPPEGVWIIETAFARLEQRHSGAARPFHRLGTASATTTPLPSGWISAAHVFPPHARRAAGLAFDQGHHDRFQQILAQHGRADLWALKQRVTALLERGDFAQIETGRHGRAVIRVALRQAVAAGRVPPKAWLATYDPPLWRVV